MTPLLLATTNPGKVREVRRLLDARIPLVTLADLPAMAEPEETGLTFMANAALKAHAYADASGLPTLAEDSGLVIDALGGAPGVHSARYPGATYPDKFANLYASLDGTPQPWTARYVCAVAIAMPLRDALVFTAEATCEGEISPEPKGTHGFGYDPIFFYPAFGRTFGEVSDEQKLAVAHRGRAIRILAEWLDTPAADVIRAEPPR